MLVTGVIGVVWGWGAGVVERFEVRQGVGGGGGGGCLVVAVVVGDGGAVDIGGGVGGVFAEAGPARMINGQETYSVFVDEVGKFESVGVTRPMLNGTASDRGSDEEEAGVGGGGEGGGDGGGVKKETDAKRLRLITDFVKEEGDVEGGGGDAVAGVATGTGGGEGGKTDEEDDDALVEKVRLGEPYPLVAPSDVLIFFKVTPRIVNKIPQDKTLNENELQHGDIVLFQRRPSEVKTLDAMDVEKVKKEEEAAATATTAAGAAAINRNSGGGVAGAGTGDAAGTSPGAEVVGRIAGPSPAPGAAAVEGGGGGAIVGADGTAGGEKARESTGLAGVDRVFHAGVWRVPGNSETAKQYLEGRAMKRVVHFMGRTERDSVLLPEGSSTQDGRAPGVSVELPRFANHREILETLCRRLEMVDDPLLLRLSAMTTGGKAQSFPSRVHLSDLNQPQYALHKILELNGGAHHSHTLIFELLPFPVDKLTHATTLVEAFSSEVVLKRHCLVRNLKDLSG
eukprot:jgi/Undpi1/13229/HiC_scaffold_8.g02891.m1